MFANCVFKLVKQTKVCICVRMCSSKLLLAEIYLSFVNDKEVAEARGKSSSLD